jgi:D-alanine--poly(phosphoribitol) ligase subunit 1
MAYVYNLGQVFEKTSQQYPQNTALKYANNVYSYEYLHKRSNQIAHYLLAHQVKKGEVVGIFNNKTKDGFASMLACLKIGATYVNLDFTSPAERLQKILNTCIPVLLLNDFSEQTSLPESFAIPVLHLQTPKSQQAIGEQSEENLDQRHISGNHPAYIMFTSGSTGFPKGVVISHQSVLNFVQWGKTTYQVTAHDTLTNVNPLYFDNSVYDFYISLFNGASLAPFAYETLKAPKAIVDYANLIKPTIWFSVPSLLVYLITTRAFTSDDLPTLRIFTFGGEGFPKPKLKQLYDMFHPRVQLINVYGPTECTCICSSYPITAKDFDNMSDLASLGRIAPNFEAIIVNQDDNGVGELCLGGPQVALGYYNDAERTQKSFVANPVAQQYRDVVYKTGDLVYQDEAGFLFFKGRSDHQIKHMGYRIELEEIEAAFNTLLYVNECGVIYKQMKLGGQIIAYLNISQTLDTSAIQEAVKKILPPYMLPKSIKILDNLPKNQNGKIDRVALKNL